ncbi:type III secretion HpaP family protein [Pandoraea sp. NPDC087047]|uniref:type III secretion HpaP family protein n=1 Tax=Pandoraea sp. NPDC087047 TaxID=3364390 RepID=UPI003812971C
MNHRTRLHGAILHAPAQDEARASEPPAASTVADADTAGRFRQLLARHGAAQDVPQSTPQENLDAPADSASETLPWGQNELRERMMASADSPLAAKGMPHRHRRSQARRAGPSGISSARATTSQVADEHSDDADHSAVESPVGRSMLPSSQQCFHDDTVPARVDDVAPAVEATRNTDAVDASALPAVVDTVTHALVSLDASRLPGVADRHAEMPREITLTLAPSVLPETRLHLQLSAGALSLRFETDHRQSATLLSNRAADLAQRIFRRTGRAVTVSLNGDALAGSHRTVS